MRFRHCCSRAVLPKCRGGLIPRGSRGFALLSTNAGITTQDEPVLCAQRAALLWLRHAKPLSMDNPIYRGKQALKVTDAPCYIEQSTLRAKALFTEGRVFEQLFTARCRWPWQALLGSVCKVPPSSKPRSQSQIRRGKQQAGSAFCAPDANALILKQNPAVFLGTRKLGWSCTVEAGRPDKDLTQHHWTHLSALSTRGWRGDEDPDRLRALSKDIPHHWSTELEHRDGIPPGESVTRTQTMTRSLIGPVTSVPLLEKKGGSASVNDGCHGSANQTHVRPALSEQLFPSRGLDVSPRTLSAGHITAAGEARKFTLRMNSCPGVLHPLKAANDQCPKGDGTTPRADTLQLGRGERIRSVAMLFLFRRAGAGFRPSDYHATHVKAATRER
ncbi:hypothetical protein SKAU_G00311000 [Synaphobranchus kaupii]|uniref:Uncharacterized protein n=1 Tax=Synaphobranchus kaupii TaxID=118154 RepID=A0A9Q1ERP9_SYNKA|nr:hypothetical protein SKAU_G00311000 [Synaphobranchus kaupii]